MQHPVVKLSKELSINTKNLAESKQNQIITGLSIQNLKCKLLQDKIIFTCIKPF